MTDSSHSMNLRGARPGVSVTQLRRRANVHDFTPPRLKAQAFTNTWQVEIVDLTGIYVRNAGMKSTAIVDGAELCRVEEFAARHFRRSGFEATFLESEPFRVLFGVYLWSVIQDRGDRQVRTVGIMAHPGYGHGESSEMIWIPLPSDFGTAAYSRRRPRPSPSICQRLPKRGQSCFDYLTVGSRRVPG
jgi:hypothetical protein